MPGYRDPAGKNRNTYRFTIHSLRDRFGTTAAHEWGYSEQQQKELDSVGVRVPGHAVALASTRGF